MCNGDTSQGCCLADHTCRPWCENTPPTGHCDISHNGDEFNICPGCAGLVLGPHCADITFKVYTGEINHSCTGGCPGDCAQRDDVHCYTEYECREEIMRPGVCESEEGAPGGVACYEFEIKDPYMFCVPCKKDTSFQEGEEGYVAHRSCGY